MGLGIDFDFYGNDNYILFQDFPDPLSGYKTECKMITLQPYYVCGCK
jgi:hypothetical protein